MIAQGILRAEQVHELALDVMRRHFDLPVSGYKCDDEMLRNMLLKAAVEHLSINGVCQELSGLAASNTIQVQLKCRVSLDAKTANAWLYARQCARTWPYSAAC